MRRNTDLGAIEMSANAVAAEVRCDEARLIVDLTDGRTIAAPLEWFPKLHSATPEERARWEPSGAGQGIHWPHHR